MQKAESQECGTEIYSVEGCVRQKNFKRKTYNIFIEKKA